MKRFKFTLLGLTVLSACASPYKAPDSGAPSATLVVHNASAGPVTLWPYSNAANCTGLLSVDSLFNMTPGGRTPVAIAVGKDFSIGALQEAGYAQAMKSCSVDATFRPEANRSYVLTYSSDRVGCGIDIKAEVTEKGSARLVPEPSFRQRRRLTGVAAAYCE